MTIKICMLSNYSYKCNYELEVASLLTLEPQKTTTQKTPYPDSIQLPWISSFRIPDEGHTSGQGKARFPNLILDHWPHSNPQSHYRGGKTPFLKILLMFSWLLKGVWFTSEGGPISETQRYWCLGDPPHYYYESLWVYTGSPPHIAWLVKFYQGYHWGEAGMSSLTYYVWYIHRRARILSRGAYPT